MYATFDDTKLKTVYFRKKPTIGWNFMYISIMANVGIFQDLGWNFMYIFVMANVGIFQDLSYLIEIIKILTFHSCLQSPSIMNDRSTGSFIV
jgi:hypothetical protein